MPTMKKKQRIKQGKIMEKFKFWWLANQTRVLWFFIGWNALSGLTSLSRGNYVDTVISAALIWIMVALNH